MFFWFQTCTYQSIQNILLTTTTTLYSHVGISSPLGTTVCFTSVVWASEWCHAHGVIHVTPLSSASFPRRHTSVIYPCWGMLREFVPFSIPSTWGCVCTKVSSFAGGGCRSSCWHMGFSFCLGNSLGVGLLLRTVLCVVQGVRVCEILPNISQGGCNSLDS